SLETMSRSCLSRYAGTNRKRNRAVKPKDRKFPSIDEHYQLQLREVVSESYAQRRWERATLYLSQGINLEADDGCAGMSRALRGAAGDCRGSNGRPLRVS